MADTLNKSGKAVYFVTPGAARARGGIGRIVAYTARYWASPDLPLKLVDSYGPGPKWQMPLFYLWAVVRLLLGLALGRVALVHVNMSERLSVWRKGAIVYLAKAFGVPVVLHLHGADFADYCRSRPPAGLAAIRRMMFKVDAVIVVGSFWRDFVFEDLGLDPARVFLLANAVPGPAVLPERPPSSTCRILFLGVVCERKGVPTLLDALADPRLADLDWSVTFAGNGEVETYSAVAARLGLAGRTEFLGWVDEAAAHDLLGQADVLVLPSRNEGLPIAILEALARGVAVVSTPVGAIADAVRPGETGLLVPVGDAPALAEALRSLVADPDLCRRLGAGGREAFLRLYEIGAYNAQLEALYGRLLRGQAASADETRQDVAVDSAARQP